MPETWDGLVRVKSSQLDAVYVLPGADFRPYKAVIVDGTKVAFNKRWLSDVNEAMRASGGAVSDEDANKILHTAQSNFDDVFAPAFEKVEFAVVQDPTREALRVSPAVIDLYVNAPDMKSVAIERTYVVQVGQATLVLEVRDSMTGALMARVLDGRATRQTDPKRASSAGDLADFRMLFQDWARTSARWLDKLKAQSPVPTDLHPGHQL